MAQASRKKQVVSLYIDLELWEQFRLACEAHGTTRGRIVERQIKLKMAEWGEPPVPSNPIQERES